MAFLFLLKTKARLSLVPMVVVMLVALTAPMLSAATVHAQPLFWYVIKKKHVLNHNPYACYCYEVRNNADFLLFDRTIVSTHHNKLDANTKALLEQLNSDTCPFCSVGGGGGSTPAPAPSPAPGVFNYPQSGGYPIDACTQPTFDYGPNSSITMRCHNRGLAAFCGAHGAGPLVRFETYRTQQTTNCSTGSCIAYSKVICTR